MIWLRQKNDMVWWFSPLFLSQNTKSSQARVHTKKPFYPTCRFKGDICNVMTTHKQTSMRIYYSGTRELFPIEVKENSQNDTLLIRETHTIYICKDLGWKKARFTCSCWARPPLNISLDFHDWFIAWSFLLYMWYTLASWLHYHLIWLFSP